MRYNVLVMTGIDSYEFWSSSATSRKPENVDYYEQINLRALFPSARRTFDDSTNGMYQIYFGTSLCFGNRKRVVDVATCCSFQGSFNPGEEVFIEPSQKSCLFEKFSEFNNGCFPYALGTQRQTLDHETL